MIFTNKTTQTSQENCTPCNRRNISYHMMKYSHVTRKTSCDRKYTYCDKRSIRHRRIFSCEINKISCDRKFISCDRNKKEHLVSQYTFPVNERIFTVTGNEYPVTGRTTNTLSHMKNISWHRRYTSCDRLNRLHSFHKK